MLVNGEKMRKREGRKEKGSEAEGVKTTNSRRQIHSAYTRKKKLQKNQLQHCKRGREKDKTPRCAEGKKVCVCTKCITSRIDNVSGLFKKLSVIPDIPIDTMKTM